MIAQVKIFNEQQLLAMAACIWMRADRKVYDNEGVLVKTVPGYDKSKIRYEPDKESAFVYCENKRVFKQLLKSGFTAKKVTHSEYLELINSEESE